MSFGSKRSKKISYFPLLGDIKKEKVYKLIKLGLDYINRNNNDTAIELFTEAISINREKVLQVAALLFKKSSLLWKLLGIAYLNKNYLEFAKLSFENALNLNPDDVESWYYLGLCYARANNLQKAVKALEKTVKKGSSLIEGAIYMKKSFEKSGNKTRITALYETSLPVINTVADAWKELRSLYKSAGLEKKGTIAELKEKEYRNLYTIVKKQLMSQ
ncbi:MAG: tetratricopeptide repeat protein [Candidatus Asgardarchaeia archaeon]